MKNRITSDVGDERAVGLGHGETRVPDSSGEIE